MQHYQKDSYEAHLRREPLLLHGTFFECPATSTGDFGDGGG
jgi:hypothetical protein